MLKQFPFELDTRLIYYVPYLVVRFTEKNNKKNPTKNRKQYTKREWVFEISIRVYSYINLWRPDRVRYIKIKYNNIQYKFIRIFLTSDKYTQQVR
jgi:hypothetical protein